MLIWYFVISLVIIVGIALGYFVDLVFCVWFGFVLLFVLFVCLYVGLVFLFIVIILDVCFVVVCCGFVCFVV